MICYKILTDTVITNYHYNSKNMVVYNIIHIITIIDTIISLLTYIIFFSVHYIPLRNGRNLLMVNSYTFRTHRMHGKKQRWLCSSQKKGCKSVVYTQNEMVISYKDNHDHDPPKYMTINGKFLKI